MNAPTETESMIQLIMEGDTDDLSVLADYVTDRGKGRLALDGAVSKLLTTARDNQHFGVLERRHLAHEILQFGGNSVSNLVRGLRRSMGSVPFLDSLLPGAAETVPYEEIVRDVAAKMVGSVDKHSSVAEIEAAIVRHVLIESLAKMDPEARQAVLDEVAGTSQPASPTVARLAAFTAGAAGGFVAYRMAVIVANSVAKTLTGRGLSLMTNAAFTRALGVALGPIGWAITGLWTVADLASPAYRVTVPCVIQLAYMRQKAINKSMRSCVSCGERLDATARFCPACGSQAEGAA